MGYTAIVESLLQAGADVDVSVKSTDPEDAILDVSLCTFPICDFLCLMQASIALACASCIFPDLAYAFAAIYMPYKHFLNFSLYALFLNPHHMDKLQIE